MSNKSTTKQQPFAVFAVARLHKSALLCATTRPDGSIGLPGGKVDAGESPFMALAREAQEEGWNLNISRRIVHTDVVDGKLVWWIAATTKKKAIPSQWKEQPRGIYPVAVLPDSLTPGLGTEFLKTLFPRQ